MSRRKANQLNLTIKSTKKKAVQADGKSKLKVLGEVKTTFRRGDLELTFEGLVVDELGVDIIGGTDFHIANNIST